VTRPEPLPGGFITAPVRIGDTVRKPPPRDPAFVHRLLGHFERHGWTGAPRYLGADDQGRDVLSFIDGDVPWQPGHLPAADSLAATARLVRAFHDLTAGSVLAGDEEVVCHNDLSPKNTVYRDGAPVAFIDWDIAAPGSRIHDVAHLCWQFAGQGDPDAVGARWRTIADGYRLADRTPLVDTVLWWQDRCWRGILAAADAGDPAMARLRAAVPSIRAAHDWTARHHHRLTAALSPGNAPFDAQ
jgi:hypothetical protein